MRCVQYNLVDTWEHQFQHLINCKHFLLPALRYIVHPVGRLTQGVATSSTLLWVPCWHRGVTHLLVPTSHSSFFVSSSNLPAIFWRKYWKEFCHCWFDLHQWWRDMYWLKSSLHPIRAWQQKGQLQGSEKHGPQVTACVCGDATGTLCFEFQNNFVRLSEPPLNLFHFAKWYGIIHCVGGIGRCPSSYAARQRCKKSKRLSK